MIWVAAQISIKRPKLKDHFLKIVRHGVEFLSDTLWDKEYGGFYWGLDDQGRFSELYGDHKHLYGNSFCIYGLAAAYKATRDPQALKLAVEAFRWMDKQAHDQESDGYYEWLSRDGTPMQFRHQTRNFLPCKVVVSPVGCKSMNTHLHLLESLAELCGVWKDETLQERLRELIHIIQEKIFVEPGAMNLVFTNDWRAMDEHDSYGHDLEAASLLLKAKAALSLQEEDEENSTEKIPWLLVNNAMRFGWDTTNGGFFGEGKSFHGAEDKRKAWWAQVEGLNALLLTHQMYGKETNEYFEVFVKQWEFIKRNLIDHRSGGLYQILGPDGSVIVATKGQIWKGAYHDGRAFLEVTERLNRLAETSVN